MDRPEDRLPDATILEVTVDPGPDDADLQLALLVGRIGYWSLDLTTHRLRSSLVCRTIYGRSANDRFALEDMVAAIHPDDRRTYEASVESATLNGGVMELEHRIRLPGGADRWVKLRAQAILQGRADGPALVGTVQDTTDRKQTDLHRALLANELNHRVKNSYSLTQAVIGQTIRTARSIREVGSAIDSRLAALATANDLLTSEPVAPATMLDVMRRALTPFGFGSSDQIQWAGPDVALSPRLVVALSLTLHELGTNATKFGALSRADGTVRLVWLVADQDGGPCLHLTWEERGGPLVLRPTRTGFGSKLIERCLHTDLHGSCTFDYRAEGVVFTGSSPLDR